ncbi:amino acid permease/ SLC12A domain-containing protein [Aspergillus caelatus]|uniref:Amino acid permease/ SLC12A domain-containing protein n=1 Tax=Aspergillus caelatus TaxID=61420 RepID=A0A5N7AAP7_9EURO|nr:amino acid permease/ SLC12A domain-containing protein [Aspergillus caelatus]KAE8366902.1 amino acid permease/ SLC12A domain-containing protein [Aspergillus caelatus]
MIDNPRIEYDGTVDEKVLEQNDPKDNASFTDIANAATFETYGHVQRDLKARHVTFIALGGNLGTGLFLGIGRALRTSGPLSLFLGYAIASSAGFMMMMALGEMAAWLPLPGAIPQFCARYVDDALGFAVGWNTWFTAVITLCAEISAACSIIQFWSGAEHVSVAVWIVVLIVALLALNILAVKVYGEAEFACALIKLCGIIGLLITALVIDLGGVPTQNRLGFHYWKTDGIMKEYIASGSTGRFLGLFSTLVNASFSLGGVETVVVAAGEAENPRRNIPRAIRRVFWRLLFFFVLASLALGMICPSNNSKLLGASSSSNAESPWVIAINLAGIKALPSIVNVVVLIAGISAGNSYVFMGSRYLYALASNHQAPKIFLHCTKQGIPIYALLVTMSISFLTFMSMGSSSNIVFQWFQNLTTVSTLYTWISICIAYMRFHAALKAQHIDRSDLPFSFPLQPYSTYFTLGYLCIVVFFNGFDSIAGGFNLPGFITSYIGFPLFFGFFLFWKIFKRTKWRRPEEADLFTGKAELDAIEWPRKIPRNFVERVWLAFI